MAMHTSTRQSGKAGPLTIASVVLALVLPPIGFVLGFAAARRESNVGYIAVFLGGIGTILGLIVGISLISPLIGGNADGPESNPIVGFTVALVVLAVVSVVGSLAWAKFTKKHDTGEGDARTGFPQRPTH